MRNAAQGYVVVVVTDATITAIAAGEEDITVKSASVCILHCAQSIHWLRLVGKFQILIETNVKRASTPSKIAQWGRENLSQIMCKQFGAYLLNT